MLSSLAHSSLEVHCSYRLKFFVAKNHLRSSSLSNCSLLGSRFARSCSTRPSQRSKYTGGVALCMRICIAVQRLSRKCVQKKNGRQSFHPIPSLVPRHPIFRARPAALSKNRVWTLSLRKLGHVYIWRSVNWSNCRC